VVAQLGLVLDCHDPDPLATLWSRALGYDLIGGAGSYVLLLPPLESRVRNSGFSTSGPGCR
jgi:hypothetical protein